PSRAPEGCHLLSCFIGGSRNPQLASLPEKGLKQKVQEELKKLLSVNGQPVFTHYRLWQHAISQYQVGYDRSLSIYEDISDGHGGIKKIAVCNRYARLHTLSVMATRYSTISGRI